MPNRDDVLSDFTVEEEISPAVLKTYWWTNIRM